MKLKNLSVVLLALGLAMPSLAKEQGLLKDAAVYAGIGPSFGTLALGNLHLGVDFLSMKDNELSIYLGPYVSMPFRGDFFGADIDVALKALYTFRLSDDMDLSLYGKTFFGMSFSRIGAGFNLGITPGAEFYFNKLWGIYTELGFQHRSYFPKGVEPNFHLPACSYTLGVAYRF